MRFFDRAKGSISIFLILVLVPMYTCVYLAIDSARYSAAKAKVQGAIMLTGNSALADYDRTIKELYGIFAISKSERELSDELTKYYTAMIDSSELGLGNTVITREVLSGMVSQSFENVIRTETLELKANYDSKDSIARPDTMDCAIKNYMKYRAPYEWSVGLAEKVPLFLDFKGLSKKCDEDKSEIKNRDAGKTVADTMDGQSARSLKSNLEELSNTDIKVFTSNAPNKKISELVHPDILSSIGVLEHTAMSISDMSKLQNAVTNCYEAEYILDMFHCLVSDEDATHPIGRNEVEYIIFGNDSTTVNAAEAVDLIFAIRLLLNSIYVYSNATMRESALTVAAAVAGWTGVGIPLVQNAILIAWATAESVMDMASLCKGNTVPVYKTASTWTLGISGITSTLSRGVAAYAAKGIDDVFDKIEKASEEKVDDIRDATLSYINQTGQGAAESLTSAIIRPVEDAIASLTSGVKTEYTRAEVEGVIRRAVNSVGGNSPGIVAAKKLFIANCLQPLTDTVYNNLPNLFKEEDGLAKEAGKKIRDGINNAYHILFSKIEKEVNALADSASGKLQGALQSTKSEVKNKTMEVINSYSEELSKYLGDGGDVTASKYSGIGMNYKDYLKLFLLIGLSGDKTKSNILKRCAVVMQINCQKRNSKFNISNVYTGVKINSLTGIELHKIRYEEAFHY